MSDEHLHPNDPSGARAHRTGSGLSGFANPVPKDLAYDLAELMRNMVEHLPAGAVYVAGKILHLNQAAEAITGYRRDELTTIDDWFALLHGDGRDAARERYEANRRTGFKSRDTMELERRGGERRVVDFAAHRSDDHEIWLLTDVTERALAQQMLMESRERLRAIVDTAVEAIITIDRDGIVQSFNRSGERMFGYTANEIIGQNVNLLMPSPFREEHDQYLNRFRSTGEARIIGIGREVVGRRKDGTTFPVELAVSEVNHLNMFTGIIRDVSDRKETEERLRKADRLSAIGTLAAGLGHDMNNVLLPVRARLELIENEDLTETLQTHFGEIRKSAGYLQDLADGLHLLALDPDDSDASGANTTLDEWWDQMRTLLGRALPKHVRLSASLPSRLPAIPVAPHRLTQAVLNLLVNAGKAVGADGRVRLWADTEDDGAIVRLGITDNGCGMTDAVKHRAFEPFFTTKTRGLGTGLGLSLVHGVVHSGGGTVDIDSVPDHGTTIVMRFPAVAASDAAIATDAAGQAVLADVSIADRRTASLVTNLLEMAGFEIAENSGPGASTLFVTDDADRIDGRDEATSGTCILLGHHPDVDRPNTIVIEDSNDFDALRAAINRAAAGASS